MLLLTDLLFGLCESFVQYDGCQLVASPSAPSVRQRALEKFNQRPLGTVTARQISGFTRSNSAYCHTRHMLASVQRQQRQPSRGFVCLARDTNSSGRPSRTRIDTRYYAARGSSVACAILFHQATSCRPSIRHRQSRLTYLQDHGIAPRSFARILHTPIMKRRASTTRCISSNLLHFFRQTACS